MDRCALFVDASYALADGAMAVHGTRRRDSVSWNHAGLLTLLAGLAKDRTGLPVLRCYWYETAAEGARTPEQDTLAEMPGLKLRLVNARPGRREGIETPLRRDLVTLAKNGAISDAFIASADEHLAEIVAEVQDYGLRVVILHISSDGGWTIPQPLRQECDDIVEISGVHLRPFVELVRGAEPVSAEELHGQEAVGSLGSGVPEVLVGPPLGQGRALAASPPQAALYAAPDAQLPGDPLASNAASAGQPSHSGLGLAAAVDHGASGLPSYAGAGQAVPVQLGPAGPGPVGSGPVGSGPVGTAQMTGGSAQVGPGPMGPAQAGLGAGQVSPVPSVPGYPNGAGRGGSLPQQQTSDDGYLGGAHYGTAVSGPADLAAGSGRNGVTRNDYLGTAVHNGSSDHGGPMSSGVPPGRPENGAATGYHAQPQAGYAGGPGVQAGNYQAGSPQSVGAQPGGHRPAGPHGDAGRNGTGSYGAPADGSSQAPIHQNGATSPGAPGVGPQQSGVYQLGPVQHGLSYQNGALQAGPLPTGPMPAGPMQSGVMQSGPMQAGLPQGPGQVDAMRAPAQAGPVQPGLIGPGPGQVGSMYPAPVAPSVVPPGHGPVVGTVFGSQGQYTAQQPQSGALVPVRGMQPVAVPLPEAVHAAHAEGFSFGELVGRDAPGLWLDAVLARKPRMPSDLEARLLQGSALPIDSLLHDEVRHSLRRGFWDALEGVRR